MPLCTFNLQFYDPENKSFLCNLVPFINDISFLHHYTIALDISLHISFPYHLLSIFYGGLARSTSSRKNQFIYNFWLFFVQKYKALSVYWFPV